LQLNGNETKTVPLQRTGIEIAMKTTIVFIIIRTNEQRYLTFKN